jgi:hypothetical protein
MTWREGHAWTLDTELPADRPVSFKVVMADGAGVRWEEGGDRHLDLPAALASADAAPGEVGVACAWADTGNSAVVARPDSGELRQRLAGLEARVAAVLQAKRRNAERRAARALAAASATATPAADAAQAPPVAAPGGAGAFSSLVSEVVGGGGRSGGASGASSFEEAVAADSLGLHAAPPESLSERVLAATVEQLLAAASGTLEGGGAAMADVMLGRAECGAAKAVGFLEELQVGAEADRVGWLWGQGRQVRAQR